MLLPCSLPEVLGKLSPSKVSDSPRPLTDIPEAPHSSPDSALAPNYGRKEGGGEDTQAQGNVLWSGREGTRGELLFSAKPSRQDENRE